MGDGSGVVWGELGVRGGCGVWCLGGGVVMWRIAGRECDSLWHKLVQHNRRTFEGWRSPSYRLKSCFLAILYRCLSRRCLHTFDTLSDLVALGSIYSFV